MPVSTTMFPDSFHQPHITIASCSDERDNRRDQRTRRNTAFWHAFLVCLFCPVGTWERNRTSWGVPSSNTLGSMSDVKISQAALLSNGVEQKCYERVSGHFSILCRRFFISFCIQRWGCFSAFINTQQDMGWLSSCDRCILIRFMPVWTVFLKASVHFYWKNKPFKHNGCPHRSVRFTQQNIQLKILNLLAPFSSTSALISGLPDHGLLMLTQP